MKLDVVSLSDPLSSWGALSPFKSVVTPVAKRPVDATAKEPPRSTMAASVPPWIVCKRFCISSVSPLCQLGLLLYRMIFVDVEFEINPAIGRVGDAEALGTFRFPESISQLGGGKVTYVNSKKAFNV
jgi:hypothetical protein